MPIRSYLITEEKDGLNPLVWQSTVFACSARSSSPKAPAGLGIKLADVYRGDMDLDGSDASGVKGVVVRIVPEGEEIAAVRVHYLERPISDYQ